MAATRVKPQTTESGHSGRLLLRMDPALHAALAQQAEREVRA